jgi:hypothetical protein
MKTPQHILDRNKAWRERNPEEAHRSKTESQLKRLYDLTIEGRDALLAAQGGRCKLCCRTDCRWGRGFTNVWHIDHVHGTKEVRGILCGRCNTFVGLVERSLTFTRWVMAYIERRGQFGTDPRLLG